jgi:hypothetical protein
LKPCVKVTFTKTLRLRLVISMILSHTTSDMTYRINFRGGWIVEWTPTKKWTKSVSGFLWWYIRHLTWIVKSVGGSFSGEVTVIHE